ncbi:carboxylesterase [Dendryphion nanum]|uniref:Carboxylic ester hydrolase n=1 Tax=Dendryphion nanum TaxID=256645 RepID=A0A9P9E0Q0_9PLEO|nr:carboxylesterase [Dendryphion nanum]
MQGTLLSKTFLTSIALLLQVVSVLAVEPVVDLGYAKYQGRIVGDGTTQWLGLRYAQPPLGELRFAAPKALEGKSGLNETVDASKFRPICLPNSPTDWTTRPSTRFTISEDCLYLNIFAPSNATTSTNLPVFFFIQGGGFGSNSNNNYNGSDLARTANIIVVSINYRVGVYGFLHSHRLGPADLNVGIRDQIVALKWVSEKIGLFGGDPEHIVIDGDSAGAASVNILLASPLVKDDVVLSKIVKGAVVESTYQNMYRTLSQGETQYSCILRATGCDSSSNGTGTAEGGLTCLRSVNATRLQTQNCGFGPNLDPEVIPIAPFAAFEKGAYLKVPSIYGSCTDEGTKNVPQSADTLEDVHNYVLSQCPSLTNSSLALLDDIYITNKSYPVFPNSGRLWRHASFIHGDMRSHCVDKIYQDVLVRDGVPTWTYRYGVRDPTHEAQGFGAYHVVNLYAVWGPNNTDGNPPRSYVAGGANAGVVDVVRGYWGRFVRGLEPNGEKGEGSPVWGRRGEKGERLYFVGNGTRMEELGREERWKCGVLDPLVRAMERETDMGERTELERVELGVDR